MSVVSNDSGDMDRQLLVSLQLRGPAPVSVFLSSLPWGVKQSMLLLAVCLDGRASVLPEAGYIDDPAPGQMRLLPAKVLTGTISLNKRFPSLETCLRDHEALIFWSYQLKTAIADEPAFPRLSGAVVLSRD